MSVENSTLLKPKGWSFSAAALAATSTIGLIITVLASLEPTAGPMFLLPFLPRVSGNYNISYFCASSTNIHLGCNGHYSSN